MNKQTVIQTLIFDKKTFPTKGSVRVWVKAHGFQILQSDVTKPGIDETKTSYRVRQRPPGDFIPGSFRTITLTEGVKAVVGRLKPGITKAVLVDFLLQATLGDDSCGD